MSNFLCWIGAHWAQISSFIVGFWIAVVATWALSTWRKQLRAQKQLLFIDELTNSVHEFIRLMDAPTNRLRYAKICIEAHEGVASGFEQYENAEAIAFINKDGLVTCDRIRADLALVRPVFAKMESLTVKGQFLGLQDYSECLDACEMLARSYRQLQTFSIIIGSSYMNRKNPQIQEYLNNISKIDAECINANLEEQRKKFIEFAKKVYEKVL